MKLQIVHTNIFWVPPGPCQYEIHDDHIEWDAIKTQWMELDEQEKLRYKAGQDPVTFL